MGRCCSRCQDARRTVKGGGAGEVRMHKGVGASGYGACAFQKAHFSFMYMPACLHTPELHGTPRSTVLLMARSFCVQPFLTRNPHTPTNTHVTPHTSPFEDRGYTSLALNKNLSLTYLTSQVHPVHHPHIAHALLDHESESQKEAATAGVYHAHRPLFFFCSCSSYLYHSRTHLLTHSSPSAAQISRSAAFIWLAFR